MSREKPSKTRLPSQKSITSFFGDVTTKAEEPPETDTMAESADESQPEHEDVSMAEDQSSDVDVDTSNKTSRKSNKSSLADASDLPPIHDISAIFNDLVSRIPEIKDVAENVAGRKLRVATMCSGTESPLLALDLIQRSILDQHGINFDIEHVFSCEIEPFKQAYIERNFHPPILFRDVCELGDGEAQVSFNFSSSIFLHFLVTLLMELWPPCQAMSTFSLQAPPASTIPILIIRNRTSMLAENQVVLSVE